SQLRSSRTTYFLRRGSISYRLLRTFPKVPNQPPTISTFRRLFRLVGGRLRPEIRNDRSDNGHSPPITANIQDTASWQDLLSVELLESLSRFPIHPFPSGARQ